MPEDVLFEVEQHRSRAEIAAVLRDVADRLEAGEAVTVGAGENSVTVDPPERPEFEIKVEREYAKGASSGELSIEFELEWDEDGGGGSGGGGDLFVQ